MSQNELCPIKGYGHNRLYLCYKSMLYRCYNPKHHNFKNYGGRGIEVCEEWRKSFLNFREWALKSGYDIGLSIDRIDNNRGYTPNNCRWTTAKVQMNNQRRNRILTYKGESHTLAEWESIIGISQKVLSARVRLGWSDEDILTTMPRYSNRHKERKEKTPIKIGKLTRVPQDSFETYLKAETEKYKSETPS